MKYQKYEVLTAIVLLLAKSPIVGSQGNPQTFWNDYPSCEEQCHQSVWAGQQCSLSNNCGCSGCLCLADNYLCETSSWLIAVAQCIGRTCGAADVTEAASIVASACGGKGFGLAVSSTELVNVGLAAIPTTVPAVAPTDSTTTIQQQITITANPSLTPISTLVASTRSSLPTTSNLPSTTQSTTMQTSTISSTSNPGTSTSNIGSTTLSISSTFVSSTTTSASLPSTSSAPSSNSSPSTDIIAAYVVPSVIGGVTIIFMLIIWIVAPAQGKKFLKKVCCCGCFGDGAGDSNGCVMKTLRGNP